MGRSPVDLDALPDVEQVRRGEQARAPTAAAEHALGKSARGSLERVGETEAAAGAEATALGDCVMRQPTSGKQADAPCPWCPPRG